MDHPIADFYNCKIGIKYDNHDDVIKQIYFHFTGPLCLGNSPVTGKFPLTKASDDQWCFLSSAPEETVE